MMSRLIQYGLLASTVIAVDQITKGIAFTYAQMSICITPFLSIEYLINRGISWGLFQAPQTAHWYFMGITLLIAFLTVGVGIYAGMRFKDRYTIYGELLVVAGSLSNLIDRWLFLGVRDFIMIHWGEVACPVFNVADVAIVCGVFWMFLQHLRDEA